MPATSPAIKTLADLLRRLGDVPLDRIRFRPFPGTATVQDVIDVQSQEGKLCELVEGVLLEKVMGLPESLLACVLIGALRVFVVPHNLGIVVGPDGIMEIVADLIRIPDVAFIRWDRLPGRRCPTDHVPVVAPNLAVEVLSRSNTPGEMAAKRQEYFAAGVELVWEIDPRARTVAVYTAPAAVTTLTAADMLTGGTVLPGFALPLQELFAELDRHG